MPLPLLRPPRNICLLCSSHLRSQRVFSSSARWAEVLSIHDLHKRVHPSYTKCKDSKLASMEWASSPPRNIMIVKKPGVESVRDALVEFAEHVTTTYATTNIILEPGVAESIHHRLSKPVYTLPLPANATPFPFTQKTYPRTPPHQYDSPPAPTIVEPIRKDQEELHAADIEEPTSFASVSIATNPYHEHTDLMVTLGGDGTILHAASLFSTTKSVPPFLSFSMGTLGFLGEFKWAEYKAAFKAIHTSASSCPAPTVFPVKATPAAATTAAPKTPTEVRILKRNRLRAGVFSSTGERLLGQYGEYTGIESAHAMNELSLHRGRDPHLAILEIYISGHFLTEAVADGLIVSTPTGSTAYSLSSGGSILHPAVPSLLLTPICPRSLSFRPLVLPEDVNITLRLSTKNRGRAVEVSVDGRRWGGIGVGQEVRVWLEKAEEGGEGGGIPCVKRVAGNGPEDGWVGGLNGLLKFNYPFGEEE